MDWTQHHCRTKTSKLKSKDNRTIKKLTHTEVVYVLLDDNRALEFGHLQLQLFNTLQSKQKDIRSENIKVKKNLQLLGF
jgi:hypothetical protein